MRVIVGSLVVSLVVLAACGGNNGSDTPDLSGASLTTDEDVPIVHTVDASDPRGVALTLQAEMPKHGTVAVEGLRVTYTPSANYNGEDSFAVTVDNGKSTATAQIDVRVNPVNDAPVAMADSFTTPEDMALVRPLTVLLANDTDIDGDSLTVTEVSGAMNGTVTKSTSDVTFTPAADFNGMASFQYTVTDGTTTSTTTVTISVGTANDAPVAADDTGTTGVNSPLVLTHALLLGNDTDIDGPAPSITAVQNAVNGTVTLEATTVTFTPSRTFVGTASFDYVVSDGTASDVGTVTITVTPGCGDGVVNAPEACDDGNNTSGDGCSATCTLQSLVVFSFTGSGGDDPTFPADSLSSGLAVLPVMSRGTGLTPAPASNAFSSSGFTLNPTLDPNDYYSFTITPATGAMVSLSGITLDERRTTSTGIRNWSVRSSLDSFATDVAVFTVPNDPNFRTQQIPLDAAFLNLTAPIEFRLYGYSAGADIGTWRLDNVKVDGRTVGP